MYRTKTVSSRFFNSNMTAENMKKLYRDLVKRYHPDFNGGKDNDEIRIVIEEYAHWYSRAAANEVKERKSEENPNKREYYEEKYTSRAYIDSLEAMIKWIIENRIDRMADVNLVGVFIWIGGIKKEDAEIRNMVKGVGFNGGWKKHDDGSSEYMWKWTPELKRFAANPNIDSIYRTYGKQNIKGAQKHLA